MAINAGGHNPSFCLLFGLWTVWVVAVGNSDGASARRSRMFEVHKTSFTLGLWYQRKPELDAFEERMKSGVSEQSATAGAFDRERTGGSQRLNGIV
jgi:hypothetical protein